MMFEILEIKETEDGGAVISLEVDRDFLHLAFEQWLNMVLKAKIDEAFIETTTREFFEENGSASQAASAENAPAFYDPDAEPIDRS